MAQILFNLSFHVLNKSLTWTHSNFPGKNTGLKNKVPSVTDSEAPQQRGQKDRPPNSFSIHYWGDLAFLHPFPNL